MGTFSQCADFGWRTDSDVVDERGSRTCGSARKVVLRSDGTVKRDGSCHGSMTKTKNEEACAAMGARLCTVDEVLMGSLSIVGGADFKKCNSPTTTPTTGAPISNSPTGAPITSAPTTNPTIGPTLSPVTTSSPTTSTPTTYPTTDPTASPTFCAPTMKGDMINHKGQTIKFDQTPLEYDSNTFVFGWPTGKFLAMVSVDAQGNIIESRTKDGAQISGPAPSRSEWEAGYFRSSWKLPNYSVDITELVACN